MLPLLRRAFDFLNEAVGWLLGTALIVAVGGGMAIAGIALMFWAGIWGVIPGLLLICLGFETLTVITDEIKTIPEQIRRLSQRRRNPPHDNTT